MARVERWLLIAPAKHLVQRCHRALPHHRTLGGAHCHGPAVMKQACPAIKSHLSSGVDAHTRTRQADTQARPTLGEIDVNTRQNAEGLSE